MDLDFLQEMGEALKAAGGIEEFERALVDKVEGLDLDVDDLDVEWDKKGIVTVQGMAADQATLEKTLLAIGNTKGVSKVKDEMVVGLTDAEKKSMRDAAAKQASEIAAKSESQELAEGRDAIKAQMEAARKRSAFRRQLETYKKVSEASKTVFYTVQKGDSLRRIADKHYGDESKWPEIFEANQPMIKKADLIYPGQMLRIPNAS